MMSGRRCARAGEILSMEADAILEVQKLLGPFFDQAIALLLSAVENGSKIVVTGIGKNLHIAEKISATLASTGSTSVFLNPSQAMHGDMGILSHGDVLLALSYSGESEELLALLPSVCRMGVRIVSLTGSPESSLAVHSDVVIPVTVSREACPFNMAPTCSTTATLAMGDALAMILLEERGFKREDYAELHPGGAIGRALLLRVKDIMRTSDSLVAVTEDVSVKEVIPRMTQARSGSACVVDGSGHLVGIFTDGDLRRHIADDDDLLSRRISDVMTSDPVSVRPDQLAVNVLGAYEKNRIDDLPVVDNSGVLVGVIDIQDLPRFKIM